MTEVCSEIVKRSASNLFPDMLFTDELIEDDFSHSILLNPNRSKPISCLDDQKGENSRIKTSITAMYGEKGTGVTVVCKVTIKVFHERHAIVRTQ